MYTIERDGQWCWFANTIASFKSEDSFSQYGSRLELASERKEARSEEGREGEIIAIYSPSRRWQSDMASKFFHKLPLGGCAEGAVPSLSTNSLHTHSGKTQWFLRLSHRQWLLPASPTCPSQTSPEVQLLHRSIERGWVWLDGQGLWNNKTGQFVAKIQRCEARAFQMSTFTPYCSAEECSNNQGGREPILWMLVNRSSSHSGLAQGAHQQNGHSGRDGGCARAPARGTPPHQGQSG